MTDRIQVLPIVAPDIGLVTGAPEHAVPDRGWKKVLNARFRKGRAEKVPGFVRSQAAALDSQIMGLFDYHTTAGFQAWIAVTRTKVWKMTPADTAFVDITGTALTASDTDWADFTIFKDVLIITNGRDPIKKWDGVAATVSNLGGSPPKAKRVTTFQNHVMLAWIEPFGAAFPQRVQWSDLGLSETWSGGEAGSLDLVDEASGIMEIMPLRDSLIAYKEDAIHLIDYAGSPFTMQTRRLATGIGPFSPRVVIDGRDTHYFLSTDSQVYKLTLAGPEIVGQAVQFGLFDELNFAKRDRSLGYLNEVENEAVFVIPTGGSDWPNIGYILNYLDTKWGRRELQATAAAPKGVRLLSGMTWDSIVTSWDAQTATWDGTQVSAGANSVLHGWTDGRVYKHTTGQNNADGVAIDCDIESKMFDFGDPSRKKRLNRLHIHYAMQAGTVLSLYVLTANGPGITPIINGPFTITLDGTGEQWIDLDLTATYFGFRFRNNNLDQPMAITGFAPAYYAREVT